MAIESDEILLTSVSGVVRTAIQRTLRSHFAAQPEFVRQSIDDLAGEAMLVLVRKLREVREGAWPEAIQNFQGYAATVASNVCYAYLRRRYPAWTRLKNQVRYVMTHDPDLALRETETGTSICVWKRPAAVDNRSAALRDLVKTVIRNAGGPLQLNDLVSAVAEIKGIRDVDPTAADDRIADPRPAASPDDASFLKKVWEELKQLPVRQRMALLLNLRDFPVTEVASMADIAGVLEMPVQELARMWNDLPIDDLKIADRLGITRQQVINLRKAARARLARRVGGYRRGFHGFNGW
jgi:RNA polymerase sigma factor (sigma-70 family)